MKISAFTIIRNAVIYDFPIVECITSALDLVDEFIVVAGDSKDGTDGLLASIKSPKVRIIKSEWDSAKYNRDGMVYAHQTDMALKACTGDWCLYLQSDEVLHEDSVPVIRESCAKYLNNKNVEGFVFKYVHIYADYKHYIDSMHFAYPREVRIVRGKNPDIHSWRDAQSFRVIPGFDYENYWQKEGTRKLNCVLLDAYIFHYGWSRDPRCMAPKAAEQLSMHEPEKVGKKAVPPHYDYGNLSMMPLYKGTQPAAMKDRIASMSWDEFLHTDGKRPNIGKRYGVKYRLVDAIEKYILRGGRRIGGFKNYNLVKE